MGKRERLARKRKSKKTGASKYWQKEGFSSAIHRKKGFRVKIIIYWLCFWLCATRQRERLKKTHIESGFSCSSARNWFPRSRSESAAWSLLVNVPDCSGLSVVMYVRDWLHDESNSVSGFEHPGIGRESTTSGLNMFLQKVNWIAHWTCSVFRSNSKSVCVPSDDSARECFFNECILPPRQDWRLTMIGGKIWGGSTCTCIC